MPEKNFQFLKSRTKPIPLDQNSCNEKNVFQLNFFLDEQELQGKANRYFIDEDKPSKYSLVRVNRTKASFIKSNTSSKNNFNKGLDARESLTETTSYESFHSCRSTVSVQNLKSQVKFDCQQSSRRTEESESTVDSGPLSNLTLVNAVFLSDHARDRSKHTCPTSDARCFSKTFKTGKASHSFGLKPRKKNIFVNASQLPKGFKNIISNALENDILEAQTVISKYFQLIQNNAEAFLSGSKILEAPTKPSLTTHIQRMSKEVIINKCNDSLGTYQCKVIEIKTPERHFEEVILLCLNYCLFKEMMYIERSEQLSNASQKSKENQKKRKIVSECTQDTKLKEPKFFLADPSVGDGDYSCNELVFSLEEEASQKEDNGTVLSTIDESNLRRFLRKILKKIYKEPCSYDELPINKNEPHRFENSVGKCVENKELNREPVNERENYSLDIGFSSENTSTEKNPPCLEFQRDSFNDERKTDHVNIVWAKSDRESSLEDELPNLINESTGVTRKVFGMTSTLPVIQEESSEERLEESTYITDGNLNDGFCLVDRQERPIRLYDSKGLPLTDLNGRPLRSAQGEPLLKCDDNGIPVVDSSGCGMFDALGRKPHEDQFDPSIAPKMAGNMAPSKLTTRDGKPLLLFDSEGLPLTSISGTTLVDSRGRGLVQIN